MAKPLGSRWTHRHPHHPSTYPPPPQNQPQQQPNRAGHWFFPATQPRDSILQLLSSSAEQELSEVSLSACVVLWLSFHVRRTHQWASQLRATAYTWAALPVVTDVPYHELRHAKDTWLRLSAVAEEQYEAIAALAEGGDAVTTALTLDSTLAMRGALRVVQQSAAATERLLQRLEKRLADLERAYEAAQQDKINRRLQALTILSAVFLPLTLMAGLWGMNFTSMPELDRPYAYYWALSSMAVVAVSLLAFFYHNGWLS